MARTGDRLLLQIEQNGYRVVLNPNEYYWGSNSVALGYAFDLIQAYEATGQRVYREGALDQLHYVLGRNTFALSFVTGVGARPVSHPYHQFSMLLGNVPPVPGMMAGGPNRHGRLNGRVLSPFPGRCYEDNAKNYYVNETAINYTAPFVFLAGYFSPLRPPATTELGKAQ
jgi:endoglucanase